MVRPSRAFTFSTEPYFDDRGKEGTAAPLEQYINPHSKPIVSYYFPKGVGEHHYGERHPMKPHRLTLTNELVIGYGLDKQIHHMYDPRPATREELELYHDQDYIDFLSRVTPQNQGEISQMLDKYNCGEDCPVFADMYDFNRMYAGASLAGARKLAAGTTDIAINWSGGLHHAKRGEASGFCYINDIVLAILELLRYHPRVLYIDIDIHHGDGVEYAFYQSNRVMTVSFHKYTGDFFPGTGKLDDNGSGSGKHYSLNIPLLDGVDDPMYLTLFKAVIEDTVVAFRPSSIVLQCGADSLGNDRLGAFNLSISAHGECVNFVRKYGLPLLVLGGGGYTIHNVSRCWTYETAVLVGAEIPNELPATVYDSYFRDSKWKLHPPLVTKIENMNAPAAVQRIVNNVRKKLRYLQGAPSVQLQEIPPDLEGLLAEEAKNEAEREEETKGTAAAGDSRTAGKDAMNEFFDGEKDGGEREALWKTPASASASASASATAKVRGRGRGRPRGRPRGSTSAPRVSASSSATGTDANGDAVIFGEDGQPLASSSVVSKGGSGGETASTRGRGRPRGRPRGRGRGRGRGRAKATLTVDEGDGDGETEGENSTIGEGDAMTGIEGTVTTSMGPPPDPPAAAEPATEPANAAVATPPSGEKNKQDDMNVDP